MKAEIGVMWPQAKATKGCYLELEEVKICLLLGPPEGTCLAASFIWVLVSRMVREYISVVSIHLVGGSFRKHLLAMSPQGVQFRGPHATDPADTLPLHSHSQQIGAVTHQLLTAPLGI